MNFSDVVSDINAGTFDGNLDGLVNLIQARQISLATATVATLNPGDKVKLKNLSPKYLRGRIATVMNIEPNNGVNVMLDEKISGRFGFASFIVRPTMVTKV